MGVSAKERDAVALCRAKVDLAKKVFNQKRKARSDELRRMLAGEDCGLTTSGAAIAIQDGSPARNSDGAIAGGYGDRTYTNLFLRAQSSLKASACDDYWGARLPTAGDLPDEIVEEIEPFYERLAAEADAMREFSDALDDGGTIGPMVLKYGIDRFAVCRPKLAGVTQEMSDLVQQAAMGDPNVHPLPGMDFEQFSKALRDFAAAPDQTVIRTIEQLENVRRVAQESDKMLEEELDKAPSGYDYGRLWTRRMVYGEDVLWDARVTTRWQDASWVAFRMRMTPEQFQNEDAFKPSAKSKVNGVAVPTSDEWGSYTSGEMDASVLEAVNRVVLFVEFWDKDTGEVHYFTEGSEYEGFLERDSNNPYMGDDNKPLLKDWFPMRACTPVVHNMRIPERALGIPWLEPGKPHAKQYVLFDTALTESRGKAGSLIIVPDDLDSNTQAALLSGDKVVVKRPSEWDEAKKFVEVIEFGKAPVDFEAAKQAALLGFARSVDMTIEEISGASPFNTATQADMAAQGAKSSRGGLVRKLQAFAGEVVRDLGALAARFYSSERVTRMMGEEFTRRDPVLVDGPPQGVDQNGKPIVQKIPKIDEKTGRPVMLPSIWDVFRASAVSMDQVDVVFSPAAHGMDPIRAKAMDDFLALMATPAGMNPVTQMPYFDPRTVWEREARARGIGKLKPFTPTADDIDTRSQIMAASQPPPEGGPNREAPGGGREDGRKAGGQRGAPNVPNRQDRGERPGDFGDRGGRAHRGNATQ